MKIKIIDLLNKIANGEDFKEKYIKYFDRIDQEYDICMICEANIIYKLDEISIKLNDEVEIIKQYNTNCELPQSDYSCSLFNKKIEKNKCLV